VDRLHGVGGVPGNHLDVVVCGYGLVAGESISCLRVSRAMQERPWARTYGT
jgi:hypothetical protein